MVQDLFCGASWFCESKPEKGTLQAAQSLPFCPRDWDDSKYSKEDQDII